MRRSIGQLSRGDYDLVVIGGGVHGAWAAWDAALRGLRVALLEAGDFCGATSGNSQKIVHGGLRYLQHGDLPRVRESIRERSVLLRLAPGLVRPLPVLVPTTRSWTRGRAAMLAAMTLSDLIGLGRNRDVDPALRLPRGRLVTAEAVAEALGGQAPRGITGGALFYDAQMLSPERIVLAVVRSAAGLGAEVANYARADELIVENGRAVGVRATDVLAGERFEVRAAAVLNCAGPWAAGLMSRELPPGTLLKAVVLLTRGLTRNAAVALTSTKTDGHADAAGQRNLFITPWRGLSLVGTFYREHKGPAREAAVSAEELDGYLSQVNAAWPGAALRRADVLHVHAGLLPAEPGATQPSRRTRIVDHAAAGGPAGALSVVGVKWTTARAAAERAVDRAVAMLGRRARGRTASTPLDGGAYEHLRTLRTRLEARGELGVAPSHLRRLADLYGWRSERVLGIAQERPELAAPLAPGCPVLGAQVVHAVREEMALRLADAVFRRTELAAAGWPGEAALSSAANLMGRELGWDEERQEREIAEVRRVYERWSCEGVSGPAPRERGELAPGRLLTGAA